jgi:hypothetical protein
LTSERACSSFLLLLGLVALPELKDLAEYYRNRLFAIAEIPMVDVDDYAYSCSDIWLNSENRVFILPIFSPQMK